MDLTGVADPAEIVPPTIIAIQTGNVKTAASRIAGGKRAAPMDAAGPAVIVPWDLTANSMFAWRAVFRIAMAKTAARMGVAAVAGPAGMVMSAKMEPVSLYVHPIATARCVVRMDAVGFVAPVPETRIAPTINASQSVIPTVAARTAAAMAVEVHAGLAREGCPVLEGHVIIISL